MRALTAIRITAGASALLKMTDLVPLLLAFEDPARMRAPVLGVIPHPSRSVVWLLAAFATAAAVLLTIGVCDRLAAGVLAAGIAATITLDAQLYANHLYLLGLVCLVWAVAPTDARALSYRWLVSIMYGFAALAKVNLTYLAGVVLWRDLGTGSICPGRRHCGSGGC